MAATGIIEGLGLIVREVSPEMARLAEMDGHGDLVGKPLDETYREPEYRKILAEIETRMACGGHSEFPFTTPNGLEGTVRCRLIGPLLVEVEFAPVRVEREPSPAAAILSASTLALGVMALLA